VTQCASSPPDVTMTIVETGDMITVTSGGTTVTGTVTCGSMELSQGWGGPDIPAGDCSFTVAVAPSGNTMDGTFGCECVTGTWSATRS